MSESTSCAMGHDDRERRRLRLQASILNPFTEQLFRRAGISSGMNVLDIGCGVGDVSLLAARLVGRYGSVTSVDIDPAALQTLTARAADEGITNQRGLAVFPISGGSESPYFEWITESFRSIQPRAIAQGIVAAGEFDLDTLEHRLREEVTAANSCFPAPAMVAAFARLRV